MDVDAGNHCEEGVTFSGMDSHAMQMVVIQYPVVDPFTACPVIVDFPIFFRAPGNRSVKPGVPSGFRIDTSAIGRRGTGFLAGTFGLFSTGDRAAPFAAALSGAVSPVDHAEASLADGSTIVLNTDGIRDGFRPSALGIEVNERPDSPAFAKVVRGIVVMSGIKAEVANGDVRVKGAEFPETDDGADAVVPPGIQETNMQGKVNPKLFIMEGKHVEGITKEETFQVAVPAPGSVGVGEMACAGAVEDAIFSTLADFVAIGRSMSMYAGAVTGECDAVRGNQPGAQGGEDGGDAEDFLEKLFKMERELLPGKCVISNGLGNAGTPVREFSAFLRFCRGFIVFARGEKRFPAQPLGGGILQPEPVDKIVVGAKRGKGMRGAADEESKQVIGSKLHHPAGQTCIALVEHENQGAKDLGLVFGRAPL